MKKTLVVLGIVGIIALMLSGVWLYRHPFVIQLLGKMFEAYTTSATPQWKVSNSVEAGVELESPYPFSWTTRKRAMRKGGELTHFMGSSKTSRSGFYILASSSLFVGAGPSLEPAEFLAKCLAVRMQNPYKGETFKTEAVTVSGIPATLLISTNPSGPSSGYRTSILVSNGTQEWDIGIHYKDTEEQKAWAERVIKSIRIKPTDAQPR